MKSQTPAALFGPVPDYNPKHLARREHPSTSHEAAEKLVASGGHKRAKDIALDWLRLYPESTAAELEEKAGVKPGQIWKRLNELEKEGKAVRTGERICRVGGGMATTWKAVA